MGKVLGTRSRRTVRMAVLTAAGATFLAACGGGTSSSTSTTAAPASGSSSGSSGQVPAVAKDPTIAALVPKAIAAKGTLLVATNATYAPDEFFASNNSTIIGWDPDLGAAIGQVLGLKFKFQNVSFDSIIPSLQSGKFDLAMSSATITSARNKQVNFVADFSAGQGFMVKKGSNVAVSSLSSVCGKKVAVENGTVELTTLQQESAVCTKASKPVSIQTYTDQSQVNLALEAGRAQIAMADTPLVAYAAKQSNGQLKVSGPSIQNAPEGIEIPKSDPVAFDTAISKALNKLIADGTYQKILAKWGVQSEGVPSATVYTGSTPVAG